MSLKIGEKGFMPKIGFGTWRTGQNIETVVYQAIVDGWRHIDSAAVYRNETETGNAIRRAIKDGICKREDLFVTSKLWLDEKEPNKVFAAFNDSLTKLQLDYIDLYLIHYPNCIGRQVPLSETWRAMEALVHTGNAINIGVSNFSIQLLMDLLSYAEILPVVNQVEMHPFLTQESLRGFCKMSSVVVTAYSPFGGTSYKRIGLCDPSEETPLTNELINSLAEKYDATAAQVILAWCMQVDNNVAVVCKTSVIERIQENLKSADLVLSQEDIQSISALNKNRRYNNPEFTSVKLWGSKHYTHDI